MRHLAAGNNIALCILDNLWRRQRRRLGGNRDCVHGVAHELFGLLHGARDTTRPPNVAPQARVKRRQTRSRCVLRMAALFRGSSDLHEANDGVGAHAALADRRPTFAPELALK